MSGAQRPQQNVYVVNSATEWPERPDPHVLYNRRYGTATEQGVYVWDGTEYRRFAQLGDQIFAYAAYSGMSLSTAQPFPDLGAGWNPLGNYDVVLTPPRGMTQDLVAGTLRFDIEGTYVLSFSVTFAHNSSNAGRVTNARLWNVTDDVQFGPVLVIGTGRNAEATSFSVVAPIEVPFTATLDNLRIEIGGGDTYTSVEVTNAVYSAWSIGEFRGT